MHIISRSAPRDAAQRHPDVAPWLNVWWQHASKARWENLHDVRADYPAVDQVGQCLAFNAKGTRYRLICRVAYANEWQRGSLFMKHCVTHAEYDRGRWRKECERWLRQP